MINLLNPHRFVTAGGGGGVPVIEASTQAQSDTDTTDIVFSTVSPSSGDLLLITVFLRDNSTPTTDTWDALSGWTKANFWGTTSADGNWQMYWKESDGTEGAITVSGGSFKKGGWMHRISGADTTTPFDIYGTETDDWGSPIDALTVTTTQDDTLGFAIGFSRTGNTGTITIDGSWTIDQFNQSTGGGGLTAWYATQDFETAGATGTASLTFPANVNEATVQFAIAPA